MNYYFAILILLSILILIALFVISSSLSSISRNIRYLRKTVTEWKKETGTGIQYTCHHCRNKYEGKQPICPHCGTLTNEQ